MEALRNEPGSSGSTTSTTLWPTARLNRARRPSALGEVETCTAPKIGSVEDQKPRKALSRQGGSP